MAAKNNLHYNNLKQKFSVVTREVFHQNQQGIFGQHEFVRAYLINGNDLVGLAARQLNGTLDSEMGDGN